MGKKQAAASSGAPAKGAPAAEEVAAPTLADVLAPELRDKLLDGYGAAGANAILPGSRKQVKAQKEVDKARRKAEEAAAAPMTRRERRDLKSKEKKLARLEDERQKKERRHALFDSLQANALKVDDMKLLSHSGALGHKMSAKEQVTRQLQEERTGVHTGMAYDTSRKTAKLYVGEKGSADDADAEPSHDKGSAGGVGAGAASVKAAAAAPAPASGKPIGKGAATVPAAPVVARTAVVTASTDGSKKKGLVWAADVKGGFSSDEDDEEDEEDDDDDDDSDDGSGGSSDGDDSDEDDDDDDEEEDDEDDDDEEEGGSGGRIAIRKPLDSKERVAPKPAAATPAAPKIDFSASKFAFSVKLGGLKPAGSASAPAPAPEAPAPAEPVDSIAASLKVGVRKKMDPTLAKLLELRERNEAARARGEDVAPTGTFDPRLMRDDDEDDQGEEESGSSDEEESSAKASSSSSTSAFRSSAWADEEDLWGDAPEKKDPSRGQKLLAAAKTATDVTLAREALDSEATKRGKKAAAKQASGAEQPKSLKRKAGDEDDLVLQKGAVWSADGSQLIGTKRNVPASFYSAYAPLPTAVARTTELQEARQALPVCAMESEIMDVITEHDVVILAGETGSGKTTQVPQFLYEAGYATPVSALQPLGDSASDPVAASVRTLRPNALLRGTPGMIAVTQPRRVAAIAMAQRVGAELGTGCGKDGEVAYQVRYDRSTVSDSTKVKFMTDGVLLREIQSDLLLRKYSVIVLDEAHERNLNTDVLIGMLSRALPLRNQLAKEQAAAAHAKIAAAAQRGETVELDELPLAPLKLIIMSATLRVDDFTSNPKLFPVPPPVVRVEARQYPVTTHFSKRTELLNYMEEAYKKVVKIHTRLPEGGILVFVTGQDEVDGMVARLQARFGPKKGKPKTLTGKRDASGKAATAPTAEEPAPDAPLVPLPVVADVDKAAQDLNDEDEEEEEAAKKAASGKAGADAVKIAGMEDDAATTAAATEGDEDAPAAPVVVLPLYALLPRPAQLKVFAPPPPGHRLIVVATNVAETSVTIPGMRYVVDCGRVKRRVFDLRAGTSRFEVGWVSQASAEQRAGRAGRTGPGHCYRLYSGAVFKDHFARFDEPELVRMPLEGVILQMKTMGIADVASFPFPSPPAPAAMEAALRTLINLGAITPVYKQRKVPGAAGEGSWAFVQTLVGEDITPLGRMLALLPLAPALAKMLVLAWQQQAAARSAAGQDAGDHPAFDLVGYAVTLAACCTVQNPFVYPRSPGKPKKGESLTLEAATKAAKASKGEDDGSDGDDDDEVDIDDEEGSDTISRQLAAELGVDLDEEDARVAKRRAELEAEKKAREEARNAVAAAHARFRHPFSDLLTVMRAAGAYAYTLANEGAGVATTFCRTNYVRAKAMKEVQQLRRQLHSILVANLSCAEGEVEGEGDTSIKTTLGDGGGDGADAPAEEGPEEGVDDDDEGASGAAAAPAAKKRKDGGGKAVPSSSASTQHPKFQLALLPPSPATETLLRQLLVASGLDHIAKRATPDVVTSYLAAKQAAHAKALAAAGGKAAAPGGEVFNPNDYVPRGRVPYVTSSSKIPELVFIHPTSAVYDGNASMLPPYLVYSEVMSTGGNTQITADLGIALPGQRPPRFMLKGCTAIEADWLHALAAGTPLCHYDAPLETPSPRYEPGPDAVMAFCNPVFGDRSWKLAPVKVPFPVPLVADPAAPGTPARLPDPSAADERLRWFARGLVEGFVVPQLKERGFTALFAAKPDSITKKVPHKRVELLLHALRAPPAVGGLPGGATQVVSAASLAAVWAKSPVYLRQELKAWLPFSYHARFDEEWAAGIVGRFLGARGVKAGKA